MINEEYRVNYIWQTKAWPKFHCDMGQLQSALSDLMQALGKISGLHETLTLDERHQALAWEIGQEAVASYAIEGEQLDFQSVSSSVMASLDHHNRHHLDNRTPHIAQLMLDAREIQAPMSEERLFLWHRMMFYGQKYRTVRDVGRWQSGNMAIVSGSIGKYITEYEAPPPEQVANEMQTFIDWLNTDTQYPLPIKAAIGHLWFESIHPFEDGNGRTGRLLIEYVLGGISSEPLPLSPSKAILKERRDYYAHLKAAQISKDTQASHIDATSFVLWLLKVLKVAADDALLELAFLIRRNGFFYAFSDAMTERQKLTLKRLFEEGRQRVEQGISRKPYAKMAGVSIETAGRDINDLLAKNVLLPSEAKGRATAYKLNFNNVS